MRKPCTVSPFPAFRLGSHYSLTRLRRRGFIPKSKADLSQWLSTLFRVITTSGSLKTSAPWSTAQPDLTWKLVRETDSQVAPQHQVRISGPGEQSQSRCSRSCFPRMVTITDPSSPSSLPVGMLSHSEPAGSMFPPLKSGWSGDCDGNDTK